MSELGVAAVTPAVVVDTEADLLDPGGPGRCVRLLLRREDARALWLELQELFG